MQTRVLYALATVGLCAAAAVAGIWIAASRGQGTERPSSAFAGSIRPPGARAPVFRLRDQDGRTVSMASYRGRTVVMAFVYSTCKDTCPGQVQSIRGALDRLGHDLPVLLVSVDPANDTPARAKRFLLQQHVTGRMRFVLGSERELAPVWKGYGIAPQRGTLDHSAYVVVVDGNGLQRIGFPHSQLTSEDLEHDLRRLG
ncbi:MAG: SCO family protein [Solirubrobacteraceae bacterium]